MNNIKWFNSFYKFNIKVDTIDNINIIDILRGGIVEVLILTNENKLVTLELSKVVYLLGLRYNILSLLLLGKVGNLKGRWSTNKIEIVTENNEPVYLAIE